MATESPLYHMVAAPLWAACKQSGSAYYPPTYSQDGFIHLTADPQFLIKVGNQFYKQSEHKEWLLLVLDPTKLKAKVIFEPAAPVGDTPSLGLTDQPGDKAAPPVLFPHLYGTIDFESVTQELPITRAGDGTFLDIPGLQL